MKEVISIINQKGGVGKTTTAVNLSSCLSFLKKKVLLIDLDPQANATSNLGISLEEIKSKNSYLSLIHQKKLDESIVKINDFFSIVPCHFDLSGAESELNNLEKRELFLKKALDKSSLDFDYIFIDCPPSLGLLSLNALCASQSFLIPLQCEYFALEGLSQLLYTISLIRKNLNPYLKMKGILLTMFDPRNNLSKQVKKEAETHFKESVFETFIPRNVRLSEAPSHGLSIIEYDPSSKGALNYLKLSKEFLSKDKKEKLREQSL